MWRILFNTRAWNIGLRTAHIAAMSVLLGGHAFDVPKEQLLRTLIWTIGTGTALMIVEAGPSLLWFHQGRGLTTLAKLLLLFAIPWLWDYRLSILMAVVVIASVGSHAPARFRYYSVLYGKVLRCGSGPGLAQLQDENDNGQ